MSRCCHIPSGGTYRNRCPNDATHYIVAHKGDKPVSGVWCEAHARAIVEEYREKLGWEWVMVPIPEEET